MTTAAPIPRPLAPTRREGEFFKELRAFEVPPSFWETSPVRRGTEGEQDLGWGERGIYQHIHHTTHETLFAGRRKMG